ncbi:MAG: class I SAM-dependent methyltransferase [Arcobacteraceae bacterium]|nr:class I SAM-dependent methyltransferase [Arcobacteraceae bacterium]
MKINDIKNIIEKNSQDLTQEFKRLFHGRGAVYPDWKFLTIDSIDDILSVTFYFECDENTETELFEMLKEFIKTTRHNTIVLQRRYIPKTTAQIIAGELKDNLYVIENGIKIKINLLSNQNSGYFPDMKIGREFVREIAGDKKVLNLFSYTCAFSLFAISGQASSVLNIDMAKGALTTGRANHHLNNLDTKNVSFFPYNILKSFSRIKKNGPYDLIIIDPPTFQKGSFAASRDYEKIIKKLSSLASKDCIILACLNSPDLDSQFIIDIFKEFAPDFEFVKRLENVKEFVAVDDERALKNLVFKKRDA